MEDLYHMADAFGHMLLKKKIRICTAESCTGGGLAYNITAIPGSSAWFDRGWVTYSNESKHELLGVPNKLIETYGSVSEEVVKAMAEGALARVSVDFCAAITGVAGPAGGTPEKPVGMVWVAWASDNRIVTKCLSLHGDRKAIRHQTILYTLQEGYRIAEAL